MATDISTSDWRLMESSMFAFDSSFRADIVILL
jgi:hypothetical protein